MISFKNKTIFITGASRGIGLSMARKFASLGGNLILLSRNEKDLSSLCESLKNEFPSQFFIPIPLDLNKLEDLKIVDYYLDDHKVRKIDVLINNAGIMIDSLLNYQSKEDITLMFNVNILAPILLTKQLLKYFIRNKQGVIINLGSIIGEEGSAGQSVYSATKSAIYGFTKSLSKELSRLKIRVNSISPGFIETSLTSCYQLEARNAIISKIPLGRIGTTEDVTEIAIFLASDKSAYITGENIRVTGGMIV